MVVVGRVESSAELLDCARRTAPDVVVVGLDQPELPADCAALFAESVTLTVLGVRREQGVAHLYQLRPHHEELGEVAPQDLVCHIRSATNRHSFSSGWQLTRQSPQ
jgi:hypothetical protein